LHICYPFQVPDFVGATVTYIRKYAPSLTVIHSTLAPGTTQQIAAASGARVVYSPVRGKHVKMERDMLHYAKFVGSDDPFAAEEAAEHFQAAGFSTALFPRSVVGELAKLMETTWLGVQVAWAQEVERIGALYGASYDELYDFVKEISFLPQGVFPGVIGGHCVMPNIAILRSVLQSEYLDIIVRSNERKIGTAQRMEVVGCHD
jgi:UDP-N-acetyl-D-mannosaminuronate dehydrogenase